MKLKSNKCMEAYNVLGAYNLFREFSRWPRLQRAIKKLTKEDWKELKRACPEQHRDLQQYI